jgi:hypothetical protein
MEHVRRSRLAAMQYETAVKQGPNSRFAMPKFACNS